MEKNNKMKKLTSLSLVALSSMPVAYAAESDAYYQIEVISEDFKDVLDPDNHAGPYPTVLTDSGDYAIKATTAQLDQDLDHGLAYTFNQRCFYSDDMCELRFNGGEDTSSFSYENAYKQWRNATFDINYGDEEAESFSVAYTSTSGVLITGFADNTDVQINDIYETSSEGTFAVGYGSAEYDGDADDDDYAREYVRRAFVTDSSSVSAEITLMPDDFADDDTDVDDDYGGFSSAYKMKEVTYDDGDTYTTLIIGQASKSFAGGDTDYYENCYEDGDTSNVYTLNTMVQCPGFDTQAWAWELDTSDDSYANGIYGFALATEWLDDNEDNDGSDITYSAAALDINSSGIAVGVSSFEYNDDDEGGRQRAIIMDPYDDDGEFSEYGAPTEITAVTDSFEKPNYTIKNSWATVITDDNMVMGNRRYATSKNSNYPVEMYIYNYDEDSIDVPLLNKKVQSTKQRLAGDSAAYTGANSQGYDMNESGLVVGKADAYDQRGPVSGGVPRTQSAFLYDSNTESDTYDESWFLDDLLCSEDADGNVYFPEVYDEDEGGYVTAYFRLESATVINDNGEILAQGYRYPTLDDYTDKLNASSVTVKLTPNSLLTSPNDSPNCWESEALSDTDTKYERSGAAGFWIWILFLPLLILRFFKAKK